MNMISDVLVTVFSCLLDYRHVFLTRRKSVRIVQSSENRQDRSLDLKENIILFELVQCHPDQFFCTRGLNRYLYYVMIK
jgi:hypothetical protein